jgi:hypothetical protein
MAAALEHSGLLWVWYDFFRLTFKEAREDQWAI